MGNMNIQNYGQDKEIVQGDGPLQRGCSSYGADR